MTIQKPNVLSYETIVVDIANCDTKEFCMTIIKKLYKNNFVDLFEFCMTIKIVENFYCHMERIC